MPSAPLFYQPLVLARVKATMIGEKNVLELHEGQEKQLTEAYENPKYRGKIDGIIDGMRRMQSTMPGAAPIGAFQVGFDKDGYVANRVITATRIHPELFETASPDQAAEIGARLVQEAQKEFDEGAPNMPDPGVRISGDTVEIAPSVAGILKAHWEGDDVAAHDAAYVGVNVARELQRSVTPLPADSQDPKLQWLEDGTNWALALWPGAASKAAAAIGLKPEAKEIDEITKGWRERVEGVVPKFAPQVRSVSALLGAAGIAVDDATAYDAAFKVLQGTPLDGVPAGIAQALVAKNELPADQTDYFAGRIVETSGSAGNIKGLLAEIELAKRPPPVDPPGGDPPGGETPPPANPPDGEQPPGTDPKTPPVDPPNDDKKPEEPKEPEQPEKPDEPGKPDEPKDEVVRAARRTAQLMDGLTESDRVLTEEELKKILDANAQTGAGGT